MRKLFPAVFMTFILSLVLIQGCRRSVKNKVVTAGDSLYTMVAEGIEDTVISHPKKKPRFVDSIYGDTVWVKPLGEKSWKDTVLVDDAIVYVSARIDTTDLIVDTVRSSRGSRIVIGFNHYYTLDFYKKNNTPWFSVTFNKKKDLERLIGGTDFWLDSNLDVFKRILYDSKYRKYVVEFNINPRYDYGSVYYFVIDTEGHIDYTGTAGGWGGGDPDGTPFITENEELYVSPFEVYSFPADTATSISDFAMIAQKNTYHNDLDEYQWLHGLRELKNNCFLVVFNREDNNPKFNALILRTDSTVRCRFRYYGMLEEMDAVLLFSYVAPKDCYYLFDSEQETLIKIPADSMTHPQYLYLKDLKPLKKDTLSKKDYIPLSFDDLGNYNFYLSRKDSTVYFDDMNIAP